MRQANCYCDDNGREAIVTLHLHTDWISIAVTDGLLTENMYHNFAMFIFVIGGVVNTLPCTTTSRLKIDKTTWT